MWLAREFGFSRLSLTEFRELLLARSCLIVQAHLPRLSLTEFEELLFARLCQHAQVRLAQLSLTEFEKWNRVVSEAFPYFLKNLQLPQVGVIFLENL